MQSKKKPYAIVGVLVFVVLFFVVGSHVLTVRLDSGKKTEVERFDDEKSNLFLMVGMTQGYLVQDAEAASRFISLISGANRLSEGGITYPEAYALQNGMLAAADFILDKAALVAPLSADPMFANAVAKYQAFRAKRESFVVKCRRKAASLKWLSFGRDAGKDFCG